MPKYIKMLIESIHTGLAAAKQAAVGDPKLQQLIKDAHKDFTALVDGAVNDARDLYEEAKGVAKEEAPVVVSAVEQHIQVFIDGLQKTK